MCFARYGMAPLMIDFRAAVHTTLLLVDDDAHCLNLSAQTMRMFGFTVVTAGSPIAAMSIMNEASFRNIDVAVLDYDMPGMNGCILAEYLKSRCPELKIILYSGDLDLPQENMSSIDAFIPKSDGIGPLIAKSAEFGQIDPPNSSLFIIHNDVRPHIHNELC